MFVAPNPFIHPSDSRYHHEASDCPREAVLTVKRSEGIQDVTTRAEPARCKDRQQVQPPTGANSHNEQLAKRAAARWFERT
eukprot:745753-Hanusia_phi.AAC.3